MNEPARIQCATATTSLGEIYLVHDEPLILELGRAILAPLGFALTTFRSAESALEAFARSEPPPRLIITDFAMQGMDGLRLVEQCRQFRPDQKVVLLSGTVDETIYATTDTRPDAFLPKPFQPDQLVKLVRHLMAA